MRNSFIGLFSFSYCLLYIYTDNCLPYFFSSFFGNRLVRAHWNPSRLEAIKSAYKQRYGKPLEARVKGETSGDYQKLLVAIVKSSEKV
jgi:Annexin